MRMLYGLHISLETIIKWSIFSFYDHIFRCIFLIDLTIKYYEGFSG